MQDNKKIYVLQKDTPTEKAGTLYLKREDVIGDGCYMAVDKEDFTKTEEGKIYQVKAVENNPEWFKPKEEEKIDWVNIYEQAASYRTSSESANFLEQQFYVLKRKDEFNKQAIESVVNDDTSKEYVKGTNNAGKDIRCAIEVGMQIMYTTNNNWDKLGRKPYVTAYSIPEDKVHLSDGQTISIGGFLNNIEIGRYKLLGNVYHPEQPTNDNAFDWEKELRKYVDKIKTSLVKTKRFELAATIRDIEKTLTPINEEKDWEIIEIYRPKDNSMHTTSKLDIKNIFFTHKDKEFSIFSVLRKSDNEVIKVDDITNDGRINAFKIKDNVMQVEYEGGSRIGFLHNTKLIKQKPILFKTEDGVPIYEGDKFYKVNNDFILWEHIAPKLSPNNKDYSKNTYSTKEKAEEYILQNKPSLSLNDLIKVWDVNTISRSEIIQTPMYKRFEQLVKDKISK